MNRAASAARSPDRPALLFAVSSAGLVAVPLDVGSTAEELRHPVAVDDDALAFLLEALPHPPSGRLLRRHLRERAGGAGGVQPRGILPAMDLGVLFALLGALVAALFTFQLAQQWRARRRHHALAWALALGCYTVGMLAQAVGFSAGWSPVTYAVYWLAGALLSVAFLAIGQLHLLDPPRAALWWTIGGLAVVWAVGTMFVSPYDTEVLAQATAEGSIPTGALVFDEGLAYAILRPITMIGALVVLGGCLWSGVRSRRYGILLIALGVAVSATSTVFQRMGLDAVVALVLAAGVSIMYLGFRAAARKPRRRRAAAAETPSTAP